MRWDAMTLNQDCQDVAGISPAKAALLVNYKQNIHGTKIKHMGRIETAVSFGPIFRGATGLAACLSASRGDGLGGGMRIRRPVSRVLCPCWAEASQGGDHSSRPRIAARLARPTRTAQAGDGPTLART